MSSLPKIEVVKHSITIDELNQTIKYRAFTNKEHKLILEAIESENEKTLLDTVLEIVDACTFKSLDIGKIPTHIVDFLYLQIHIKSTGERQLATYTCGNVVDDVPCNGTFQLQLPIEKAKIVYPEGYNSNRIVWVDEKKGIGIKMKSPNFDELKTVDTSKDLVNITDHFIMTCIESVFTNDSILKPGVDFTTQECIEWFDDLDGHVLQNISNFFREMPYVGLSVPVTCPICKRFEELELRGIEDFFG